MSRPPAVPSASGAHGNRDGNSNAATGMTPSNNPNPQEIVSQLLGADFGKTTKSKRPTKLKRELEKEKEGLRGGTGQKGVQKNTNEKNTDASDDFGSSDKPDGRSGESGAKVSGEISGDANAGSSGGKNLGSSDGQNLGEKDSSYWQNFQRETAPHLQKVQQNEDIWQIAPFSLCPDIDQTDFGMSHPDQTDFVNQDHAKLRAEIEVLKNAIQLDSCRVPGSPAGPYTVSPASDTSLNKRLQLAVQLDEDFDPCWSNLEGHKGFGDHNLGGDLGVTSESGDSDPFMASDGVSWLAELFSSSNIIAKDHTESNSSDTLDSEEANDSADSAGEQVNMQFPAGSWPEVHPLLRMHVLEDTIEKLFLRKEEKGGTQSKSLAKTGSNSRAVFGSTGNNGGAGDTSGALGNATSSAKNKKKRKKKDNKPQETSTVLQPASTAQQPKSSTSTSKSSTGKEQSIGNLKGDLPEATGELSNFRIRAWHVPHYVRALLSSELDEVCQGFLQKLLAAQDKWKSLGADSVKPGSAIQMTQGGNQGVTQGNQLTQTNQAAHAPLTDKQKELKQQQKRMLLGFREVARAVRKGKLKGLVIAPNLDVPGGKRGGGKGGSGKGGGRGKAGNRNGDTNGNGSTESSAAKYSEISRGLVPDLVPDPPAGSAASDAASEINPIITPNPPPDPTSGVLATTVEALVEEARLNDIPVIFALSRKSLAWTVNRGYAQVSAVGLLSVEGYQREWGKVVKLGARMEEMWLERQLMG